MAHGRSSITIAAEVIDPGAGTRFARADTVVVCTDAAGRPRPWPERVVATLAGQVSVG